jgi:hypothetical protein
VSRDHLRTTLQEQYHRASNLRGGGPRTAFERLLAYLEWAQEAAAALRLLVSAADIDRLVLTRRYEILLAGVGGLAGADTQRVVNGLVSMELDQRVATFEAALLEVDARLSRWTQPGVFMVPDTSFFIEHDQKMEEWDLAVVLTAREAPIHVLVPMVVVDELDSLKRSKDKDERWRARYSLAVIDRVLAAGSGSAQLRAEDFSPLNVGGIPRGRVTLEVLVDPSGHVRLPINDDEIVDRAVAVQPLTGGHVTLVTYDTGQSTRARIAGLAVVKLAMPPAGEQPPRT